MKRLFFFCMIALTVIFSIAMTSPVAELPNYTKTVGDYYVYVHVAHPDGGNYSGAKIQGSVCGVLGGMTEIEYTDSKGYAKLTFSSNSALCKIFVNGKTKEERWESGDTAYFTAR